MMMKIMMAIIIILIIFCVIFPCNFMYEPIMNTYILEPFDILTENKNTIGIATN